MNAVQSFVSGMALQALRDDARTVAALKYELLVLGEAVAGLSAEIVERRLDLPWAQMRALRNVVAHEYFRVDVLVSHAVAMRDVPALLPKMAELLETL